jgi:hypothetical protein
MQGAEYVRTSTDPAVLAKVTFDGLWRGRVEYNKDPLQMGRIKVRIWECHGPECSVQTKAAEGSPIGRRGISHRGLPWARPVWNSGGAYDTGQFDVPSVGSNVWVMFERGSKEHPVYFGTYNSITVEPRKYGTVWSQWEERELPIQPPSMGTWNRPPGPMMPLESQEMKDHDPTIRVFFKTPKGHTMYSEEADEKEALEILDRAGQGIRWECHVTNEANEGNAEQRGLRSVFRGDQVSRDVTVGEDAKVMIADLLNQGILISSRKGEERLKLISNDETGKGSLEAGLNRQEIELNAGHKLFVYRGVKDGRTTTLIRADSTNGIITVDTDERVVLKSSKCVIDASLKGTSIYGDVTIHGNLHVNGTSRFIGPSVHIGHITATTGCTGCSFGVGMF